MLKINDGIQVKRIAGKSGDRAPLSGIKRERSVYIAVGGETSINLNLTSPTIAYLPGLNQLSVTRSSTGKLISGLDFYEKSTYLIEFPLTSPLVAGEWVEIIKEVEVTGLVAVNPRPDMYTATGEVGQTLVSADFSWPYNMFPNKGQGGCQVYLNGLLQTRGADYTEVNLNQSNTNQILFVDPLIGEENIIIRPSYQVIDQTASTSLFQGSQIFQIQEMVKSGTQDFVETSSTILAPYTYVNNRAKIPDIAKDLRASLGVERIQIESLFELQNEFGPNGERAHAAVNDDRGLIRFVGNWEAATNSSGSYVTTSTANDYVEITFYGTGLNALVILGSASLDLRATVDNGAESANLWTGGASYSNILQNRNYSPNQSITVASGLALGVHTVRIKQAVAGIGIQGFEVLNTDASGLVSVVPGSAYINAMKCSMPSLGQLAHNAAATGTKGGRSVIYLNSDGTLGQSFQAVDLVQNTLASTNHYYEEVARAFNWREFGASRADDFSTLNTTASSSRAFTLDDGTTTLVGSLVNQFTNSNKDLLGFASVGGSLTFTFIGTGVDLNAIAENLTGTGSLYIDGVLVSAAFAPSTSVRVNKIASGLPYGTHTIKLVNDSYTGTFGVIGFTVYQPKKPAVPQSSIELCDYNLLADYSANTSTSHSSISAGVIRKMGTREITYAGTWSAPLLDADQSFESGFNILSQTSNSYAEYYFYGTGIDHFAFGSNAAQQWTIAVDGSIDLSSYTTGTAVTSGSWTLNPLTGVASGTPGGKIKTYIRGLPLGWHKVRITGNNGSSLHSDAYDVISPIHSYKSSLPGSLQNTLMVGGSCVADTRKVSLIKDNSSAPKAWAQAVGIAEVSTTSTSYIPMPDMSLTIKTSGNPIDIYFGASLSNTFNAFVNCMIYVNGSPVGVEREHYMSTSTGTVDVSGGYILPLPAGTYKVDIYWKTSAGTMSAIRTCRLLKVRET